MEATMVMQSNRSTTSSLTPQAGVTLIELMAGTAIGMTIVAAAFTILTTTSKSLRANEQVVGAQQNLRLAMELLSRDIKLAGFGNPGVPIGNCTYPIMPKDQTPAAADSGPDSVQLLVPATRSTGSNKWTLKNATPSTGTANVTLQSGAVADMVTSGLTKNVSYVSIGGSATALVTDYDSSASTLKVAIPPPLWFQAGDPIYLLQCIRYQVVSAPDPGNLCGGVTPCLTRGVAGVTSGPNAEAPIAEGIEDLQLAYACDGCTAINSGIPDRSIDDVNAPAGFGAEDFLSDVPWTTAPLTPDKIKLVQIALVATQSKADDGFGENMKATVGSPPTVVSLDHTLPADPNHRRRVLVKTVDTRNIGS